MNSPSVAINIKTIFKAKKSYPEGGSSTETTTLPRTCLADRASWHHLRGYLIICRDTLDNANGKERTKGSTKIIATVLIFSKYIALARSKPTMQLATITNRTNIRECNFEDVFNIDYSFRQSAVFPQIVLS